MVPHIQEDYKYGRPSNSHLIVLLASNAHQPSKMFKHMLLLVLFGLVYSAPAPDAKPEPAPKTPASTEKLTPVIAPLPSLAAVPQIALPLTAVPLLPIAYTYVAPLKIAAVPSTYTVEQHGYSITY